jgi:mannan endo-1,4-beta-mannosidase
LLKTSFYCIYISIFFLSCKKTNTDIISTASFHISGSKIYNKNTALQLMGANSFHSFSAGSSDMNNWSIDISREFIGNMTENPITGTVIKDANGSYLYPLQLIADSNHNNHRITIFCPFGWDGTSTTLFTGTRPTQTAWWTNYKNKLQQWAIQFKDQPDVWIEVWNEPYRYDRADGYTDAIWLSDMNEMVTIIRNAGNNNIILVPCAEQGQDESVLINQGNSFLSGKNNIIFDIHAYEKWLLVSAPAIGNRLQQLQQKNIPVIFGETAPMNAGTLMNPQSFLDSAYNKGLSVCAWAWKYDGNDQDALLAQGGLPNNNNNNSWGTLFKNYCSKTRKP